MKKTLIILLILITASTASQLRAQDVGKISPATLNAFNTAFRGVEEVKWEMVKDIYLARFRYQGDVWIAYLSPDGKLLSSGRKVKTSQDLPIIVRDEIASLSESMQKKYEQVAVANLFEMVTDGSTEYFLAFENGSHTLLYSISTAGASTLRNKVRKTTPMSAPKTVIASKK